MPSRSSGRNSCDNSVDTSTTSPAVKRPWLQPHATHAIPPASIALVIAACPMFSHARLFSLTTAASA